MLLWGLLTRVDRRNSNGRRLETVVLLLRSAEAEDCVLFLPDNLLVLSKSEVGVSVKGIGNSDQAGNKTFGNLSWAHEKEFTEVEQNQANLTGDSQGGTACFYSLLFAGL